MSAITEEQRIALNGNSRYQSVAKQYVKFIAQYYAAANGEAGDRAGLATYLDWGRQRFIAFGIKLHPDSQPYQEWASQMVDTLKGADVWVAVADGDPNIALQKSLDATIDSLISTQRIEQMSKEVFALRATRIEF